MSTEVERKRRLRDGPGPILASLSDLGYQADGPVTETDTYFSRQDVDYLLTVECLRVRRRGGFAEITYKPPSSTATHAADDIISKQETNVRLASGTEADAAVRLLSAAGMVEIVRVRKIRTTWQHPGRGDTIVAVDQVDGLGWFTETEVTSPDAALAAVVLRETEEALGLNRYPSVSQPYRDLLLAARPRPGLSDLPAPTPPTT